MKSGTDCHNASRIAYTVLVETLNPAQSNYPRLEVLRSVVFVGWFVR